MQPWNKNRKFQCSPLWGQVQTPYFTWAESNANEQNPLFSLICIRCGSCEVRRLNLAWLSQIWKFCWPFERLSRGPNLFYIWFFPERLKLSGAKFFSYHCIISLFVSVRVMIKFLLRGGTVRQIRVYQQPLVKNLWRIFLWFLNQFLFVD